ncbi:hypothetical protein F4823DRAFT_566440 [Ustulina deusta]|nr:hypothetical protein F4823DRAFT_566440 [Ustulina deusta]
MRQVRQGQDFKTDTDAKGPLIEFLAASSDDVQFIRSQIIQGMMASQETTSALLGNTIFLLARHPKILATNTRRDFDPRRRYVHFERVTRQPSLAAYPARISTTVSHIPPTGTDSSV